MNALKKAAELPRRGVWLFVLLLLVSCDVDRKQTEQAVRQIQSQVNDLSRSVGDFVAHPEAPEELKKLQQFEYRVEAFPREISPSEFTERLNVFGRDRWECSEPQPRTVRKSASENLTDEWLVVCKRRPETPLRYLPRTLIGVGQ